MPLGTVKLLPGVNTEQTAILNEATINASQLIRFKMAGQTVLAEKLGGWARYYNATFGSPIRNLFAWEGINHDTHLAVGCELSLDVVTNGTSTDVTPFVLETNPAVNFSTTSASKVVTIVDAGIATTVYDAVFLQTPVSVGGIVLYGEYAIASVLSPTSYTITAATPATATVANGGAVPAFTTATGSSSVLIDFAAHGYSVGEQFPVLIPLTVGGITISGVYLVQSIPGSGQFRINASVAASSSATASENGGNARFTYYVAPTPAGAPTGYGIGGYGTGGYGVGVTSPTTIGTAITATNWTLDNWGEILMACPANGPIYSWSPDSGFTTATKVPQSPVINGGIFVAEPAQILVAWASSTNGIQDPLLVQWSDSGDYTNWSATALTQAGNFRFPTGSRIIGGIQGPQYGLIWTDLDLWAMNYIEPPLVFGFNKLATECGLISRHATAVLNSSVFWMGGNSFYMLSGGSVTPIPCTVWDFVYQDLDTANSDKIYCGPNNGFGEVSWFFPSLSGGTGDVDSYVKYNIILNAWDCGRLARSAWIDQSVLGAPLAASPQGYVYQHDIGTDADGQPMNAWFETGFFQISDGEDLFFVDWIIPDFKYGKYGATQGANVQITLMFCDYPSGPIKTRGPYTVSAATTYVNTRLRGRQVAFRVESNDLGSFWRMGGLRYRGAPDGKR